MANLVKSIIYFMLSIQEKILRLRLRGKFDINHKNSDKKKYVKDGCVLNLGASYKIKKEQAVFEIRNILKQYKTNPQKLIEYIENNGTKIIVRADADFLLALANERVGLITYENGFRALFFNMIFNKNFSFKSDMMLVLSSTMIEPHFMVHQFYKWYMINSGATKPNERGNKLMEKMLKTDNGADKLSYQELTDIKNAIEFDKDAINFVIELAKSNEGSKKVLNKIATEGSASV